MGCWHCRDAFWQHVLYIWLAVPGKTQSQNSRKSLWVACGHTFWWDYPYVWLAVTGKTNRQNILKSLWVAGTVVTLSDSICIPYDWQSFEKPKSKIFWKVCGLLVVTPCLWSHLLLQQTIDFSEYFACQFLQWLPVIPKVTKIFWKVYGLLIL